MPERPLVPVHAPVEAANAGQPGTRLLTSLRARLLLLVVLALGPVLGLFAWQHYQHQLELQREMDAAAHRFAYSRAIELGGKIADTRSLLAMIADFPEVKNEPGLRHCSELLAGMKRHLPHYANLGVAGLDGTPVCSATPFDPAAPPNFSDRLWFRHALTGRDFTLGEYLVGRVTGQPSLAFSRAVPGDQGAPVAIVFAALDLAWLPGLVMDIDMPENAAMTVLDHQGRILARHPDHAVWVGKLHPQADRLLAGAARSAEEWFEVIDVDGVKRRLHFSRVPGNADQISVFFGLDAKAITARARSQFTRDLGSITAIVLAGFALVWLVAEQLVLKRTQRLSDAARRLAAGDLAARSGIKGNDEIGRLARVFDQMAASVAGREQELAQRVAERTRSLDMALKEVEDLYDHAPCGYHSLDRRGVFVRVNATELDWLGYSREELVGRMNVSDILAPHSLAIFQRNFPRFMAEGHVAELEFDLMRKDGSLLPVTLSASAIFDADGGFVMSRSTLFDMTEHRLAREHIERVNAELAKADQLKSEFLASMSHELRTPLNSIIGFSEVLRDGLAGEISERQREYLTDIVNSGVHLLALINDILDLSKVEAGKMELDLECLPVASLLHTSLSVVREKASAHSLTLTLDLGDEVGEICADSRKLKQIVYNLLANAVKFTPDGGQVTLSARRVPRVKAPALAEPPAGTLEWLEIAVTDTGIGIAPDDQLRLFTAFTQIDSSLSREHTGTGLGLALVKRLAELHGGTVGLESRPQQGSTFRVWLPYRPLTECLNQRQDTQATVWPGDSRVLVVEDDPAAFELLRLILEQTGFTVSRAADAASARAALAEQIPDLITLDILLPGEDGWQFLDALKCSATYGHIPVVVVSIIADQRKGFALGASAVLQKPLLKADLQQVLVDMGFAAPRSARVLVVDDDPLAVERLALLLSAEGHQVDWAGGGNEALAMALAAPPDLVLLDLMMPDLSGFEVVEMLRADPRTRNLAIVIVTAKLLDASERARLNGQVAAVVQKCSFSSEGFLAEVRRVLASASVRRP